MSSKIKQLLHKVFLDIRKNQGFGYCYEPQPYVLAFNTYLAPDYKNKFVIVLKKIGAHSGFFFGGLRKTFGLKVLNHFNRPSSIY